LNNATEDDTIEPQAINEPQVINPLLNVQEKSNPHLGNPNWQAIINSQTWPVGQKQVKSDYIDCSEVGLAFKLSEASKNVNELDLSAIPNVLKQMVHY